MKESELPLLLSETIIMHSLPSYALTPLDATLASHPPRCRPPYHIVLMVEYWFAAIYPPSGGFTSEENELMYGFEPVSEPDGAKIHSQDARLMCSGH